MNLVRRYIGLESIIFQSSNKAATVRSSNRHKRNEVVYLPLIITQRRGESNG